MDPLINIIFTHGVLFETPKQVKSICKQFQKSQWSWYPCETSLPVACPTKWTPWSSDLVRSSCESHRESQAVPVVVVAEEWVEAWRTYQAEVGSHVTFTTVSMYRGREVCSVSQAQGLTSQALAAVATRELILTIAMNSYLFNAPRCSKCHHWLVDGCKAIESTSFVL